MSRRPRGSGGGRAGRGGGRGGGGGIAPPALEVPLQIPGLMAWLDSRTTAQMTLNGSGVASWASRAGSLGTSLAWVQATAANQPTYVASEPLFAGRPAVLFDGVNDWLEANDPNAGTRLHNGLGASVFRVLRVDGTGAAAQRLLTTSGNASTVGTLQQLSTATQLTFQIANGSGTLVNSWNITNAAHTARDLSRWQMWGHATGTAHSRVSGSSLTNADTGGPPSTGPAAFPLRIGASNTGTLPFKGWLCTEIYYDHVLTAGETSQLAAWAAAEYPGVAA